MENPEAVRNFDLKQATLWERVFYYSSEPDEVIRFLNAQPGNCTLVDLEDFKEYSDLIRTTNPDGYITYTHVKGLIGFQLFITFHEAGYKEFKAKEA